MTTTTSNGVEDSRSDLSRKAKKIGEDDTVSWDAVEAVEGVRNYQVEEKLKSDKYNHQFIRF